MLSFIESLKELISEVEATGGSPIQKTALPDNMVLKLKAHIITKLRSEPELIAERTIEDFLLEEFVEGFFEDGLRAAFIYLGEIGISKFEDVEPILRSVLDRRIDEMLNRSKRRTSHDNKARITIDDAIVQTVQYVWDKLGSKSTTLYSFARSRFLIIWDYRKKSWQVTNLGRFLLDLNPLQAITFLLTVDLTLGSGENDFDHISKSLLEALLNDYDPPITPHCQNILRLLGILRTAYWYEDSDSITPLGKVAIRSSISENNSMVDVVISLVETEERGLKFEGSDEELDDLLRILNADTIEKSTKSSLSNAISFYRKGDYVDAARIFFPSIEAIVSNMLLLAGEDVSNRRKYSGLASKVAKLEELSVIPSDLAKGIEITSSRNKILHGEFEPSEQDYAYPICVAGIMYLRRLIANSETFKNNAIVDKID